MSLLCFFFYQVTSSYDIRSSNSHDRDQTIIDAKNKIFYILLHYFSSVSVYNVHLFITNLKLIK